MEVHWSSYVHGYVYVCLWSLEVHWSSYVHGYVYVCLWSVEVVTYMGMSILHVCLWSVEACWSRYVCVHITVGENTYVCISQNKVPVPYS